MRGPRGGWSGRRERTEELLTIEGLHIEVGSEKVTSGLRIYIGGTVVSLGMEVEGLV